MSSAGSATTSSGPFARLIADERVQVAETDPRWVQPGEGLFEEETGAIAKAVLSRRQQYTAARCLARRALAGLGLPPCPLLNDGRRAPIWPPGIVGSITHTQTWCAVAVARASEVSALGIDVEVARPLEPALWERVCRPGERDFLLASPQAQRGLLAKAIFSAKESAYKALYPAIREFLDFQGMSITLHGPLGGSSWHFDAELQTRWGALEPGHAIGSGKLLFEPELILTAIVL